MTFKLNLFRLKKMFQKKNNYIIRRVQQNTEPGVMDLYFHFCVYIVGKKKKLTPPGAFLQINLFKGL